MFFGSVSFMAALMYSGELSKQFVLGMALLGPASVGSFVCAAWLDGRISALKKGA